MEKPTNVDSSNKIFKPVEVNVDTVYERFNEIKIFDEDNNWVGWNYDEFTYSTREYIEKITEENTKLQAEDLNNKEAIAELYMLSMGGV